MFKKIIERKTRNGIFAFFLGLLIAIMSLYVDVIRGDALGTIGIYQVVGALAGYTLSGIGVVLVMKATKLRKTVQNILLYSGGIIAVISVTADHIGIAGMPGFDKFQVVGVVIGIAIFVIGFFLRPQILSQKLGDMGE